MNCSECNGTGVMYGAKCGFCYGSGQTGGRRTKGNRSEAQEAYLSHYTCICGAYEQGLQSHGMDCPWSYEGKSVYGKKLQYKDKESLGAGGYRKTKKLVGG